MRKFIVLLVVLTITTCVKGQNEPYILVLGTAQDAGYPQIACEKECCLDVKTTYAASRLVSAIGIVDPEHNESWIFDATPDFTEQTRLLTEKLKNKTLPDGIFLTHGHIGHYTGLMYLGREAISTKEMPVYVMPRMKEYLTENGPWSQLVKLNNINLRNLNNKEEIHLNKNVSVMPIVVPHRDEFTETVGYLIKIKNRKILFIPDIDKWSNWKESIVTYIKKVDIAFLDATFYKNGEINRDMSEVPHPFVEESMLLFKNLSSANKEKIYFIHFNHTNPLLHKNSEASKVVKTAGFNIAREGMIIH